MSSFVIYILKHDRWCFKSYAKGLLVNDETKKQMEVEIDNIIESIDSGETVENATHYIRVSDTIIKMRIDSLYASLFNYTRGEERLPLDEFSTTSKWSVILSYIWHRVVDGLSVLPSSNRAANYSEQLEGHEIKTFLEQIANYKEPMTMEVDVYDPNEANKARVRELQRQLELKLSEQFHQRQQMQNQMMNYRNFAETQMVQFQQEMKKFEEHTASEQEKNIWLRENIMYEMKYAITMKYIVGHLMARAAQLNIEDMANINDIPPGELNFHGMTMVMKSIQSALQCRLGPVASQITNSRSQMSMNRPPELQGTNLALPSSLDPGGVPDNRIQLYLQEVSQNLQQMQKQN